MDWLIGLGIVALVLVVLLGGVSMILLGIVLMTGWHK